MNEKPSEELTSQQHTGNDQAEVQQEGLFRETGTPQVADKAALQLLEQRIAELESLSAQYKDQLLRKAAEFENYKKRVENDFIERVKYANEDIVFDLLPVLDDFERSLKSGKEMKDFDTLYRGIELINQKLIKILDMKGAIRYDSVGKPFDPHLHDALMQIPRADLPPHTVIDEVEKGYMMHGKVLRHAKVIVSSDSTEETTEQKEAVETESPKDGGGK